MTATAEKTKGRRRDSASAVVYPQVNLLPPEVKAARTVRRVKAWLGLLLVVAVLGNAAVVFLAISAQGAANQELTAAQSQTERLRTEAQKYAEVPQVLSAVDAATRARELGTSTEILWAPYLSAISASMPPGVSIDTISVTGVTPMTAPVLPPSSALAGASVATITFGASSLTVPDTAAWLDALSTVPGFTDAWFSSASVGEDQNGIAVYTVSATVQIDSAAFARRFATTEVK